MEREEMKRIQKEMEKRLGDDWDIQPVTVNKVGGHRSLGKNQGTDED